MSSPHNAGARDAAGDGDDFDDEHVGVEMAIMVASMLHAIATGNLLPSSVRTVVVDMNPAVVTKLADRGSFQAAGLVTDAELFLRELLEALS